MAEAASGTRPAGAAGTDWGHVAMVLAIAAFCAWYLFDAARASPSAENLLLIGPAAVIGVALALGIAWGELRRTAPADATSEADGGGKAWRTLVFVVLMALYVAGLAYGPFDVATFLFTAASLYALGERRWVFLIAFSAILTVSVLACLVALLPGSLPLLLPL